MPRSAAAGSREAAQEAAQEALTEGANALGAVLAGFFTDAGEDAGVLFASLTLMLGGLGSGVYAYDGRHRQPGKDAKRPRGFQEGEEIPSAARVAVPGGIFALSAACAYHQGATLLAGARRGVAAAKRADAKPRADLLELVATKGSLSLSDQTIKKAWVSKFGAVEEGLVTPGDLVAPDGLQHQPKGTREWTSPWSGESVSDESEVILAADANGLFAGISYSPLPLGPQLDPFRVSVPLTAIPVLRGVTRTSPGVPIERDDDLKIYRNDEVEGIRGSGRGRSFEIMRPSGTKEVAVRLS